MLNRDWPQSREQSLAQTSITACYNCKFKKTWLRDQAYNLKMLWKHHSCCARLTQRIRLVKKFLRWHIDGANNKKSTFVIFVCFFMGRNTLQSNLWLDKSDSDAPPSSDREVPRAPVIQSIKLHEIVLINPKAKLK